MGNVLGVFERPYHRVHTALSQRVQRVHRTDHIPGQRYQVALCHHRRIPPFLELDTLA